MKNKSHNHSSSIKKPRQQKMYDLSKQDNFLFNKTPILASALQKLKKNNSNDKKKQIASQSKPKTSLKQVEQIQQLSKPTKKVKKTTQQNNSMPSFAYTPLEKDLYNFYTINKISLKSFESVPEPKFEVGSLILTAICDRGIGGKYLVTNLFRNKKGYIDYKQLSQAHAAKDDFAAIQSYLEPGPFVVASVVKSINNNHLQISTSKYLELDTKNIKVGQVIPAQIKSKQQLGCHLLVYKCKNLKFFIPKSEVDEQLFQNLVQNTQIIVTISEIDHSKSLIKVKLASQDHIGLNLRGLQQQDMNKIELQQYVCPGTLLNTKITKLLKNGVMVKFLKIFVGFIHVDHLQNNLQYYSINSKIEARVIYSCINPPLIYLSQRHVNLNQYNPKRSLYSAVNKPQKLSSLQGSYLNKQQQFFVHPSQLHTQIDNVTKFWVKQNNYFQRYQIMSSKKLGLRVGQVAKQIPFNNFKIYAEGEGSKFKVMCLDVWNKVIKVSYDQKFIKSTNMLTDVQDAKLDVQYCGIIKLINQNGVTVQFCNNIRGIIPKNELKMQQMDIKQNSIGKSIQVYINNARAKKSFVSLSLYPPTMRNKGKTNQNKSNNKNDNENQDQKGQQTYFGVIASVDIKSIHPIYIKLKSKIIKISIFNGVRPASTNDLPIIRDLSENFKVGQKVRVFRKGKQYYLYPPQQLSDKNLRICKVLGQKGSLLRLQIGKSQFKNCNICDITDIITPYPFSQVKAGQYKIGRILNNGMMCLRDSVVINGIPKSMIQCKQKYHNDELRGDYRNRILTVGSAGLKQNIVLFGYIKTFSQKGCFVSISNDFEVRVQMCELTDQYVQDKTKLYPPNKLMLLRLISQKTKPNDPTKHFFDASARESVVKMGNVINQEALMVGLTVSGKISAYTKGKALVKIDGSKFTGIMNPNQVQGLNREQPIQKTMKLGTQYTMKIIQLSNQGRRLIRLSTLSKYFNKYKGVELGIMSDQNAINLWDNYQMLLQEEPPANNLQHVGQFQAQQQNQQDEYQRIKKLVGNQLNQQIQDQLNQQDQNDQIEQQNKGQHDQDQQESEQQNDEIIDQRNQNTNKANKSNFQQNLSKQQVNKRLSQFRQMNSTSQIYQSIILANDSSQSHLQYIASLVSNPSATPQQIRQQFKKSIAALQTNKDKQNMWVAWLNMELILGNFMGLVKQAISQDAGLNVYSRIIQILREQDSWDLALQMSRKMLKKFNKDYRAYILMMKHMVLQQVYQKKQSITFKQLMRRAAESLKMKQLTIIQSHYGKILYQQKMPEQARTVFSSILTKHPKRTDLWSMYVDLELKHGNVDKAREILQRCLSIKLKRKKMITMLKKYHQIQQTYGTKQSAAQVLQRAKQIAANYEEDRQQEQSDQ